MAWRVATRALVLVAVLVVVLALPVAYAATGVVDQKQETQSGGVFLPVDQPAGQEFVPSLSPLIGVDVIVTPALPGADVTVNIRESTIDGNIISTVSQYVSTVPPPPSGWIHFDLPSPVPVTVGSTYVLELTTSYVCVWYYGSGDPYPPGMMIRGGAFVPDLDFTFRTYATSTEPVGGVVMPTNTCALLAPWIAVVGLVGCIGIAVVVVRKRRP